MQYDHVDRGVSIFVKALLPRRNNEVHDITVVTAVRILSIKTIYKFVSNYYTLTQK